jgi:hypothetical protein
MIRIKILVEGQTEETFVRDNLSDYFANQDIFLTPILIHTSKTGRGGVTSYAKIHNQVTKLCLSDPSCYVTTMLDYYGLPTDFPGKSAIPYNMPVSQIITSLETAFSSDINEPKQFIPNLMVHEFEALLFSDISKFKETVTDNGQDIEQLFAVRAQFATPEDINNSPETAPSKRIIKQISRYKKVIDGCTVARAIGLDKIRQECHHFNSWINRLCQITQN